MKAEQPRKVIGDEYDKLKVLRELEVLHKRINDIIIAPANDVLVATKADYAAGDVGTAAAIATALNTLAAAINLQTVALNAVLAKLNAS